MERSWTAGACKFTLLVLSNSLALALVRIVAVKFHDFIQRLVLKTVLPMYLVLLSAACTLACLCHVRVHRLGH